MKCKECRFLSAVSEMGYRYCNHPKRIDKQGKIENVHTEKRLCPLRRNNVTH